MIAALRAHPRRALAALQDLRIAGAWVVGKTVLERPCAFDGADRERESAARIEYLVDYDLDDDGNAISRWYVQEPELDEGDFETPEEAVTAADARLVELGWVFDDPIVELDGDTPVADDDPVLVHLRDVVIPNLLTSPASERLQKAAARVRWLTETPQRWGTSLPAVVGWAWLTATQLTDDDEAAAILVGHLIENKRAKQALPPPGHPLTPEEEARQEQARADLDRKGRALIGRITEVLEGTGE